MTSLSSFTPSAQSSNPNTAQPETISSQAIQLETSLPQSPSTDQHQENSDASQSAFSPSASSTIPEPPPLPKSPFTNQHQVNNSETSQCAFPSSASSTITEPPPLPLPPLQYTYNRRHTEPISTAQSAIASPHLEAQPRSQPSNLKQNPKTQTPYYALAFYTSINSPSSEP
ncbi:hypothetical protein E3N88_45131 [Mikania micrantha]|uniref:Uncharacterized protein n=1 Tax=Mikania micrantha TaxID=192012 RepID=A0A5N6LAN0_9ASTR|nr:hypothetical protein E3N88_45131 [Mikania micrantha]